MVPPIRISVISVKFQTRVETGVFHTITTYCKIREYFLIIPAAADTQVIELLDQQNGKWDFILVQVGIIIIVRHCVTLSVFFRKCSCSFWDQSFKLDRTDLKR